ncbi:hypothetical protein APSETT445_005864 [Aspergillus pseudonomiae]
MQKAKEHQQGISWILRKTISASSSTLKITQGSDEDGEWMTLEPALAGGLQGTPEKRQLTWAEFEHNDTLFGRVIIRSHYIAGQRTADGRVRPLVEPFTKVVVKPEAGSILAEAVVLAPETAGAEQEKTDKAFIHDSIRSMYHEWTAEQVRTSKPFSAIGHLLTARLDLGSGNRRRGNAFDT